MIVNGLVNEWSALEHRLGVLPLLEAFFEPRGALDDVIAGRKRGALGLFTPTAEPGWAAAALAGEASGDGMRLRGDVRLAHSRADGSIVPVRGSSTEFRLAWLDHGAPGVERRGGCAGGPVAEGPCWLRVEGAEVGPACLSRPVSPAPDGELAHRLAAYASGWAEAAVRCAREGLRALRRAARTSGFQASQLVALEITEVEIETDLTAAAVERTGGLAVAAAAARTLAAVAAKAEELRDSFGLEVEGSLSDGSAKVLTAFLGGPLLLESQVARALGLGINGGGR